MQEGIVTYLDTKYLLLRTWYPKLCKYFFKCLGTSSAWLGFAQSIQNFIQSCWDLGGDIILHWGTDKVQFSGPKGPICWTKALYCPTAFLLLYPEYIYLGRFPKNLDAHIIWWTLMTRQLFSSSSTFTITKLFFVLEGILYFVLKDIGFCS